MMVDNLGKNMMLDTWDNKIFMPRFYDCDTICSYDNSGQLKFDVDIEMAQGYWNTSSSRLWTRIRDLMHDDLVAKYNDMRQNGLSYESLMKCFYDEQIAKIPQKYYNMDYDVKYAPFADSYIGMANGDVYEHVKRWLQQRLRFVDTLYDYAPSYNNDVLTIRANTTEPMTLYIETYTPVYQHLSWYNNQMDKKKIDGKIAVEFTGTAMAATDQEVLIYGGSNIKSIKGIQSMNPNRMLIGAATKLTELDASNCPLLADVNANKANFAPHVYLNKLDISGCPLLGGNLIVSNSPLLQEIDIQGTAITGLNLPSNLRNLKVLKLTAAISNLTLNDASQLHTLEFELGSKMETVSMTNCNALTNVVNFDLENVANVTLNNSYNITNELYFSKTTNLSLRNMSNLERVVYTPNTEHEVFDKVNVDNASNYTISTFNCPKLNEFVITAPYRNSYGKDYGEKKPNEVFEANVLDISSTQFKDVKLLCTTDTNKLLLPRAVKNLIVDSAYDLDTEYLTDGDYDTIHTDLHEPYNTDYEGNVTGSENVTELITWYTGNFNTIYPSISWGEMYSDKIYVKEGTSYTVQIANDSEIPGTWFKAFGFDSSDTVIWQYGGESTSSNTAMAGTIPSGVVYVRFARRGGTNVTITYTKAHTPNIVPSASDGSLIFSMYAPSMTDEPDSGVWDMTDLDIETIHIFGLNNDVKPIYDYVEKSIVIEGKNLEWEFSWGSRDHTYISNTGFKSITPLLGTNNMIVCFDKDGNRIAEYASIVKDTTVTIPANTHNIELEYYTSETSKISYDVVYEELELTQIQMPNRYDDYTFYGNTVVNINSGCNLANVVLSQEALLRFINNLPEVTTSPTLTLGTTNLAKLTEGQIAIAINKGWTVV